MMMVVLIVMAVASMFFLSMSFLSRGQIVGARHYLDGSRATILAEAGARWVLTGLASGTCDLGANAVLPAGFYQALFGTGGGAVAWSGDVPLPPYLEDYRQTLAREEGERVELKITARLLDLRGLPAAPGANPGFVADPIEKFGKLEITATAAIGRTARRVRVARMIKVFLLVHPVLARFTLFVRRSVGDREALNLLTRTTAGSGFGGGRPLVLCNGAARQVVSGGTIGFQGQTFDARAIARENGWVFLGGTELILGLSGSGGDDAHDDRALLRFANYANGALALPPPLQAGVNEIKHFLLGYNGVKDDLTARDGSIKPLDQLLATKYLTPLPSKVSLLRPYGTNDRFTPTVIFGPVARRYLAMRALACLSGGRKFLSGVQVPGFRDEAKFTATVRGAIDRTLQPRREQTDFSIFFNLMHLSASDWPGNWRRLWQPAMCNLETEPFNHSLDFIVSNHESGTLAAPVCDPAGFRITPGTAVGQIEAFSGNPWTGEGSVKRGTRSIFAGRLGEIEGLGELLPKLTHRLPAPAGLLRFLDGGTLRLGGVVHAGTGNYTFDRALRVERGGIIIIDGDVEIAAPITSAGEPLTIVATRNLTISTTAPVRAHLVCRRRFAAPGGFALHGTLAAGEIDWNALRGGEKTITWDTAHDPLASHPPEAPESLYRFRLAEEEEFEIEPGA